MFVYKLYYIKCGHKIEEEKPSQKSYWGLTKDQLENELDDEWFIESFSPEEVVLIKTLDKFCDNHYYVGIQDGYVTLFQGIPGNESLVLQKTDIMADILRYEDRVTLEKGVIIEDKREFLQIKEGLAN
ncbi:MAG: hypothetical protein GX759_01415, partial [Thermoanaerobacterales bacterium]|nr:hypothetical protein [Thermoanaerobacterales bacterium]